ncbi:cutinase family protein [Streptomyces sp. B8F3]|uniref:cutinase family protein n=1 Tax=unclassified Streptomyces TaxID=2593676 RepID=UPI00325ED18B
MSTEPHVRPDIALIGVRGTTEPQTGSNLLRPLGDRIIEQSPHHHTTYTELEYPATFDFTASVGQGVRALADLLNQSTAAAPHRLHVLMGYSQGAWVIGETLLPPSQRTAGQDAAELSPRAAARISAVLFYGDPRFTDGEPSNRGTFEPGRQSDNPRPPGQLKNWQDRLQNYCAQGDLACQGSGGTYFAHLAYLTNAMPAQGAAFALERLAADLTPGELR